MTTVSIDLSEEEFAVVVAAEEEPSFPPLAPADAPVVASPEAVALPVPGDPPPVPAGLPPDPAPPPQLTSTTASLPFSALFIVLRLPPLEVWLEWASIRSRQVGRIMSVPLESSSRLNIPVLPEGQPHSKQPLGGADDPHPLRLLHKPHPGPAGALGADHPQPRMPLGSQEFYEPIADCEYRESLYESPLPHRPVLLFYCSTKSLLTLFGLRGAGFPSAMQIAELRSASYGDHGP